MPWVERSCCRRCYGFDNAHGPLQIGLVLLLLLPLQNTLQLKSPAEHQDDEHHWLPAALTAMLLEANDELLQVACCQRQLLLQLLSLPPPWLLQLRTGPASCRLIGNLLQGGDSSSEAMLLSPFGAA